MPYIKFICASLEVIRWPPLSFFLVTFRWSKAGNEPGRWCLQTMLPWPHSQQSISDQCSHPDAGIRGTSCLHYWHDMYVANDYKWWIWFCVYIFVLQTKNFFSCFFKTLNFQFFPYFYFCVSICPAYLPSHFCISAPSVCSHQYFPDCLHSFFLCKGLNFSYQRKDWETFSTI